VEAAGTRHGSRRGYLGSLVSSLFCSFKIQERGSVAKYGVPRWLIVLLLGRQFLLPTAVTTIIYSYCMSAAGIFGAAAAAAPFFSSKLPASWLLESHLVSTSSRSSSPLSLRKPRRRLFTSPALRPVPPAASVLTVLFNHIYDLYHHFPSPGAPGPRIVQKAKSVEQNAAFQCKSDAETMMQKENARPFSFFPMSCLSFSSFFSPAWVPCG
jgi:hypothetical protein